MKLNKSLLLAFLMALPCVQLMAEETNEEIPDLVFSAGDKISFITSDNTTELPLDLGVYTISSCRYARPTKYERHMTCDLGCFPYSKSPKKFKIIFTRNDKEAHKKTDVTIYNPDHPDTKKSISLKNDDIYISWYAQIEAGRQYEKNTSVEKKKQDAVWDAELALEKHNKH